MSRRTNNGSDYGIGFGKTPEYTRFKPGQSGNPNGRPKKDKGKEPPKMEPTQSELDEILRAEFDRTIAINEGGKPKKRKARELVARAQVNNALKGNSLSQQHVLKAIRDLESRDAERSQALAEQLDAERQEEVAVYKYMVTYKKEREAVWAEAEARGTEPDDPWPHPDDILLFDKKQRWRPRGPFDAKDLAFYNSCRAERDHLLAFSILQQRLTSKSSNALDKIYTILWVHYDVMLPLRWQVLNDTTSNNEIYKLHLMPLRTLRTLVRERQERSEFMKRIAGLTDERDKEIYKFANTIMKPLLKPQGYRSLAEFEQAFKKDGENMPWPKSAATW
jgi:Family of unknown function (DUF5681)